MIGSSTSSGAARAREPRRRRYTATSGTFGDCSGKDRIVTHGSGNLLRVHDSELDAERFERLLAAGRAAEALALWHGQPFFNVRDDPFAQAEVGRLEAQATKKEPDASATSPA